MNDDKYVDIRPYNDQEAVLALARISKHPVLSKISAFLFPGKDQSELGKLISTIDSVYDFQGRVMLMAIKKITSGKWANQVPVALARKFTSTCATTMSATPYRVATW